MPSPRISTIAVLILLFSAPAWGNGWNMPEGVTAISREVHGLHMFMFWVCVVIGVLVFGMMLWTLYFHRKSRNYQPAKFTHNTTAEVIWTVIPIIILVALAFPAGKTLTAMYDTSEADVNIKITGHQWKWEYEYLDQGVGFFSHLATPRAEIYNQVVKGEDYLLEVDNPVVVPTGQKVRFLVTANDVLHSWWVPDLAVKRDAVPGFLNEAWAIIDQPGIYRGQCAELCGADHAFMPIVVDARSPEDYQDWLADQQVLQPVVQVAVVEQSPGEQVYNARCAACHQNSGAGLPPAFPSLHGSSLALADDYTELVTQILMGQGAMPAFAAQLDDQQIADVLTYIRSSWGNSAPAIEADAVSAIRAAQ